MDHDHDHDVPVKGTTLSLADVGALLPGPGILMPDVSRRAWYAYYAAKGGSWQLARYMLKQLRHRFKLILMTRPKYDKSFAAFLGGPISSLEQAIDAEDWPSFEATYDKMVKAVNQYHVQFKHPEIIWKVPPTAPEDLEI